MADSRIESDTHKTAYVAPNGTYDFLKILDMRLRGMNEVYMMRISRKLEMHQKEVKSFLRLTGYYKNFIPNYAAIASPLCDLRLL